MSGDGVDSFHSRKTEDLDDFLLEYQKQCGSDYDLEFVCSDGSVQFYQVGSGLINVDISHYLIFLSLVCPGGTQRVSQKSAGQVP